MGVSFCGRKRQWDFNEDPKTRSSTASDMADENKSASPFCIGAKCSGDDANKDKASVTDDAELGFDAKKEVGATPGDGKLKSELKSELKSGVDEEAEKEKWREKWRESGFDEEAEKEKWRQFGKTRTDSRGAPLYDSEQMTNLQLKALLALPTQTCGPHGLRKRVRAPPCGAAAKETQGMQQHPGGGSRVASVVAVARHLLGVWGGRVTGALSGGTRRRQENKGQVLDRPDMTEKVPSQEKNTAIEV